MSACFDMENTLPVSLAHSMVAVICNLKLWLNYASVIQLFIPLRSRVMKYMCRLGDKELRTPAVRTMAGMFLKYNYVHCRFAFANIQTDFLFLFKHMFYAFRFHVERGEGSDRRCITKFRS